MYGPTDLKKNTLITLDGQPYKVVEYSQKVMAAVVLLLMSK